MPENSPSSTSVLRRGNHSRRLPKGCGGRKRKKTTTPGRLDPGEARGKPIRRGSVSCSHFLSVAFATKRAEAPSGARDAGRVASRLQSQTDFVGRLAQRNDGDSFHSPAEEKRGGAGETPPKILNFSPGTVSSLAARAWRFSAISSQSVANREVCLTKLDSANRYAGGGNKRTEVSDRVVWAVTGPSP